MKKLAQIIFSSLFLSLCLTANAQTQPTADVQNSTVRQPSTIRVNGEATVPVKPDRAQLDIGVVTQGATSQETVTQNTKQIEAVVTALRKLLGADADIKTISYQLTPKYKYVPQQEPTITGFTAINVVRIMVKDLNQLSKVIDMAGNAGANQIQSLQFMVGNQQAATDKALNEAALNARRKANQLASTMGVEITRIASIIDSTPTPPQYPQQYNSLQFFSGNRDPNFMANSSISSPAVFAPRTIEVRATVTLIIEIRSY